MNPKTVVLVVSSGLVVFKKKMKQSISTNQDKAAKSGGDRDTNPSKVSPTVSVK